MYNRELIFIFIFCFVTLCNVGLFLLVLYCFVVKNSSGREGGRSGGVALSLYAFGTRDCGKFAQRRLSVYAPKREINK